MSQEQSPCAGFRRPHAAYAALGSVVAETGPLRRHSDELSRRPVVPQVASQKQGLCAGLPTEPVTPAAGPQGLSQKQGLCAGFPTPQAQALRPRVPRRRNKASAQAFRLRVWGPASGPGTVAETRPLRRPSDSIPFATRRSTSLCVPFRAPPSWAAPCVAESSDLERNSFASLARAVPVLSSSPHRSRGPSFST